MVGMYGASPTWLYLTG